MSGWNQLYVCNLRRRLGGSITITETSNFLTTCFHENSFQKTEKLIKQKHGNSFIISNKSAKLHFFTERRVSLLFDCWCLWEFNRQVFYLKCFFFVCSHGVLIRQYSSNSFTNNSKYLRYLDNQNVNPSFILLLVLLIDCNFILPLFFLCFYWN